MIAILCSLFEAQKWQIVQCRILHKDFKFLTQICDDETCETTWMKLIQLVMAIFRKYVDHVGMLQLFEWVTCYLEISQPPLTKCVTDLVYNKRTKTTDRRLQNYTVFARVFNVVMMWSGKFKQTKQSSMRNCDFVPTGTVCRRWYER